MFEKPWELMLSKYHLFGAVTHSKAGVPFKETPPHFSVNVTFFNKRKKNVMAAWVLVVK
jgi:hypothetical protein